MGKLVGAGSPPAAPIAQRDMARHFHHVAHHGALAAPAPAPSPKNIVSAHGVAQDGRRCATPSMASCAIAA